MKRAFVLIPVALVIAYWAISLGRSLVEHDQGHLQVNNLSDESQRIIAGSTPPGQSAGPQATQDAGATQPAVASDMPAVPFKYQSELESYALLKGVVLPTQEQLKARIAFLSDPELLSGIAQRLTTLPLPDLGEQDIAVDILLDALTIGNSDAAEQALQAIVQDAQVEDTNISHPVREQLAGMKAEILYNWSATLPERARKLASFLPGPTSQKIWENVLRMQANNRAESAAEGAGD